MLKSFLRGKIKAKRGEKRAVPTRGLLAVDGVDVAVSVKLNPRARRIVLRVNPATGEVVVTAPARGGPDPALAFARRETLWIARQLQRMPEQVALMPGAEVPYLGLTHPIRHSAVRGPGPDRRIERVDVLGQWRRMVGRQHVGVTRAGGMGDAAHGT